MKLTALSTTDPLRRPCLGRQHRLVECYVFVDNYLQDHPGMAAWRRSNNDDPEFTDAEVLTIALTGGYFQTDSAQTDLPACLEERAGGVPGRAGYKQWIRRLTGPADLVGQLVRAAALKAVATNLRRLYVVDSLPIPLCDPPALRAGAARPSEASQRGWSLFWPIGQRLVFRISDSCSHSSAYRRSAHRNAASGQLG